MADKSTLGRLPREAIRMLELPRVPRDLIEGYKALVDLTGTVSDSMDELGIVGVVPACMLPPVNTGTRIVGPALTVRNIQRKAQIHKAAQEKTNTQGESEAHNLDEAGVCFVPREQAAAVLEVARKIDGADTRRKADIEAGVAVSELMTRKYKTQ
jgi:regulator of RNase E activity RraA